MKLEKLAMLLVLTLTLPIFNSDASVQTLSVEQDGIVGTYFHQSISAKMKPVLVLGGSEGGIPTRLAETIAEQGYPTLALAYFKERGLPQELEKIPLEYLNKAKTWLKKKHPQHPDITLVGWSKGAELSLLLASIDKDFDRVVAIASSSVVWAGILNDWQKVPGSSWTHNGQERPYVPFNPTGPITGLLDLYSQSLENRNDENKATIGVENIQGNVYLYSGGMDQIWPSTLMAKAICERMAKNTSSSCTHFDFPTLDHLLGYKFLDSSDAMHQSFLKSLAGAYKSQ